MENISTEKKLEQTLKNISKEFKTDKKVKEFEKALEDFKDLVSRGIAQKRGNNLISITESHRNIELINSKDKANKALFVSNL